MLIFGEKSTSAFKTTHQQVIIYVNILKKNLIDFTRIKLINLIIKAIYDEVVKQQHEYDNIS